MYLLVGLGDGHLLSFCADATTVALSDRRRVSLGSQPVTLRAFSSKGAMHVFACSDRPTARSRVRRLPAPPLRWPSSRRAHAHARRLRR